MEERAGKASFKVPGGKLVTARIAYDSVIRKARLTGDFFVHPEEGLRTIESALEGLGAGTEESGMAAAVQAAIDSNSIQTIGIDAESVAKVVRMAIQ